MPPKKSKIGAGAHGSHEAAETMPTKMSGAGSSGLPMKRSGPGSFGSPASKGRQGEGPGSVKKPGPKAKKAKVENIESFLPAHISSYVKAAEVWFSVAGRFL